MDDTNKIIREIYQQMLMKKTGIERLMISFSMFDFARKIVKASIMNINTNLPENELRQKIFLKYYGADFSVEERERIVKYLEGKSSRNLSGSKKTHSEQKIYFPQKTEKM